LKLFIKNMVNLQSLSLVKTELVKLGLRPLDIAIGEADVLEDLSISQHTRLRSALWQSGLELLENKTDILVHRIRRTVVDAVYSDVQPAPSLSAFLSLRLGYDYTHMSNMFSAVSHTTIERFHICHKIERVKQLLIYEGLTLTAIAEKMNYSSVSHASSQFKKITGMTPSQFKHENRYKRPEPGHCG
jgi:AraC-like DNA-binding protein